MLEELKSQHEQVGGDHYDNKGEFAHHIFVSVHDINWHLANAIKYILRHHRKNKKQDLDKAADYCRMYAEALRTWPSFTVNYRRPKNLDSKVLRDFCDNNDAGHLESGLITTLAILCHMEYSAFEDGDNHISKFYDSFADHIDQLAVQRYGVPV